MESNKWENQTFQILNQVIECPQALWISGTKREYTDNKQLNTLCLNHILIYWIILEVVFQWIYCLILLELYTFVLHSSPMKYDSKLKLGHLLQVRKVFQWVQLLGQNNNLFMNQTKWPTKIYLHRDRKYAEKHSSHYSNN